MNTTSLVRFVSAELRARRNPEKARGMQRYMKTDMPFYGVQKPARQEILRALQRQFSIESRKKHEAAVRALWELPHREEKYIALSVARAYQQFLVPASVPMLRRLIVEGAWWDFADEVATQMISPMHLNHRKAITPIMNRWIDDGNMWLRRTAILSHIKHKRKTNEEQLTCFCLKRAHESEFFIRKAIGWALREYAWTNPQSVTRFVNANRDKLSKLSVREALKNV